MKDCSLPIPEECLAILEEYHVPTHIISHSKTVAKLAVFLAQRLNENGEAVDITLLEGACLLHDLLRVHDFKESCKQAHLQQHGYQVQQRHEL